MNDSYTVQEYYNLEVGNSSNNITDNMKVGLMYVSDYGYSAPPDYWTADISSNGSIDNNYWMYSGAIEWTISRDSNSSTGAFRVYRSAWGYFNSASGITIRPVFYLNSNVQYASGTGTSTDPFRIT